MIAYDFITDSIPPIKSTDTVGTALDWMGEFKIAQLPIVDNGKFQGLITEDELMDAADLAAIVGDIRFHGWDGAYVYVNQHMYEAIDVMGKFKLEVLPVLDEDEDYLGLITQKSLLDKFAQQYSLKAPGGIIIIEVAQNSYTLSEIGRIVESADAKVLSLYASVDPHTGNYRITLKLNVEDLSRVVASFERYEYNIVNTFIRSSHYDDYQDNFDALMKYLNI